MPKTISVEGTRYTVTEQPAFNHSLGCQYAMVDVDGKDTAIVKQGAWRFLTPRDRTAPLRAAARQGWPFKQSTD